jgi:hypothetical protein
VNARNDRYRVPGADDAEPHYLKAFDKRKHERLHPNSRLMESTRQQNRTTQS